ncbi:MAG TPA: parallel beta-helix domain-containing protein [Puia sp.]|nr:parallel beta-helix domain-containing protein [Puia sp.]
MIQTSFRRLSCRAIAVSAIFCACNGGPSTPQGEYHNLLEFGPGQEPKIIEAFLTLKDSSEIHLAAGTYRFENLSLAQLKHIQIRGDGPDKTILDFSAQTQGGEGIRVTDLKYFSIRDMTIRDSKGDLIKINRSEHVRVTNFHAIWQRSDSTSGGYAIYPVLCRDVIIDSCDAEGSSDAGIYVGQTDSAIVRNCKASRNVAGCENENTSHAQVYDNEFFGNTAGFLAFDLPGLSKRGGFVKVYHNYIHDNNSRNFAKAGSFGTYWGVGNASPGSGVIVLAASNIDIYDNRIENNNSSAIALASGLAVDDKALEKINANYFPISKNISIHDNTMTMGNAFPAPAYEHHIGKLLVGIEQKLLAQDPARKNKRIPFIMYDGISTNILNHGIQTNPDSLCIRQTGDNIFVNADFLNITKPSQWHPNTDVASYNCH